MIHLHFSDFLLYEQRAYIMAFTSLLDFRNIENHNDHSHKIKVNSYRNQVKVDSLLQKNHPHQDIKCDRFICSKMAVAFSLN